MEMPNWEDVPDWSEAPEGATHCWIHAPEFFKRVEGVWFVWYKHAKEWNEAAIKCRLGELITRPTEWNGEGLPPVGTVCEWKEKAGFTWVAAEVLFLSDQSVVLKRADGFEWQEDARRVVFRNIRTSEQIAAAEREAAVVAMLELDPYLPNTRLGMMSRTDFCCMLHDAGYRLQKNP